MLRGYSLSVRVPSTTDSSVSQALVGGHPRKKPRKQQALRTAASTADVARAMCTWVRCREIAGPKIAEGQLQVRALTPDAAARGYWLC